MAAFACLAPAMVLGLSLIGFNCCYYGHPLGGQAKIEAAHAAAHGVAGSWSGEGLAGTLVSPNRGLLVFSPWAALAMVWVPALRRRLLADSIARWMVWAVLLFWLLVGGYSAWWGGHCFGPRYWTEAMPLFALPLACGWDRAGRAAKTGAVLLIAWSVAVQYVGAFRYPSDWNVRPANVDLAHERLWDWRDTELRRCTGW